MEIKKSSPNSWELSQKERLKKVQENTNLILALIVENQALLLTNEELQKERNKNECKEQL